MPNFRSLFEAILTNTQWVESISVGRMSLKPQESGVIELDYVDGCEVDGGIIYFSVSSVRVESGPALITLGRSCCCAMNFLRRYVFH
jgi:hypothetical protein